MIKSVVDLFVAKFSGKAAYVRKSVFIQPKSILD